MQSMNISLPEPLKQFVDGQIADGRYSSVSEHMRELIRADEKRKAEDRLEAMLLEGLCSGLICPDTLISGIFTYGGVYDDKTQSTQGI